MTRTRRCWRQTTKASPDQYPTHVHQPLFIQRNMFQSNTQVARLFFFLVSSVSECAKKIPQVHAKANRSIISDTSGYHFHIHWVDWAGANEMASTPTSRCRWRRFSSQSDVDWRSLWCESMQLAARYIPLIMWPFILSLSLSLSRFKFIPFRFKVSELNWFIRYHLQCNWLIPAAPLLGSVLRYQ